MIRLSLLLALAFLVVPSAAAIGPEDSVIGYTDNSVAYIDPAHIKMRNGFLTAWIGTEYRSPNENGSLSTKELVAFDCANEETGLLNYVNYPSNGSRGTAFDRTSHSPVTMNPVIPGSIGAGILETVCAVSRGESIDDLLEVYHPKLIEFLREKKSKDLEEWWIADRYFPTGL